jgi:hypothetical protein
MTEVTYVDRENGKHRGIATWKGHLPRVGEEVVIARLDDLNYEDIYKVIRIIHVAPGKAIMKVAFNGIFRHEGDKHVRPS